MKLYVIWIFCLLFSPILGFAQTKDAERTVVKHEETKRGNKTTTDTFKGDLLIRKQVEERRTNDKPLEAKYTRHYRDGHEVLFEYWDSKSKETVRYFTQDDRTVMAELDRDGDGLFEWVVLFGNDEKVSAVFRRTADGKMELLDGAALDTFNKGSDAAKKLFER